MQILRYSSLVLKSFLSSKLSCPFYLVLFCLIWVVVLGVSLCSMAFCLYLVVYRSCFLLALGPFFCWVPLPLVASPVFLFYMTLPQACYQLSWSACKTKANNCKVPSSIKLVVFSINNADIILKLIQWLHNTLKKAWMLYCSDWKFGLWHRFRIGSLIAYFIGWAQPKVTHRGILLICTG